MCERAGGYELVEPYYRSGPLPPVVNSPHREEGTLEFLHRWEELIGEMCRSGFMIEDLLEPVHADAQLRRANSRIAAATSRHTSASRHGARAKSGSATSGGSPTLWTPLVPRQSPLDVFRPAWLKTWAKRR